MNEKIAKTKKRETPMDKVVERLRRERDESHADWVRVGHQEGRAWAQRAHYAELRDMALTAEELQDKCVPWDSVALPEDMEDILKECLRGDRGPGFDGCAFAQGFHDGVLAFWAEVSEQL